MTLKLPRGDCYRIPHEKGGTRDYSFAKKAGKNLIFVDGTTLRPVPFDEQTFAKMIHEKVAVRQLSSNWLDRIDIHALMDPTLENTPKETRKKIKRAQSKVAEAAMYRFYVVLWDKTPEDKKSRSADGYTDFIEAHYQAALNAGHFHKPSYSAFRRALEKSTPHERELVDLISKRGNHNKWVWDDLWVVQKLGEAVDEFYSEGCPKPADLQDVVVKFLGQAIEEQRARRERGEKKLKYPKRTAVENHIRGQETKERLARRDPKKAQRIYGGRGEGATAEFPLQRVQVDQSRLDQWINIYNEDGNVEDRKRPWLVSIIDVYSRSILAAILTFDDPSTYTVQLAIKQMLRPKTFLIERFGTKKGATDAWGQPKEVTFDNGVENPGLSMRLLFADAGIDMEVAPIETPQAKAIVERGFQTYNQGVWHSAPGGIPYKPHAVPDRRLKPEEKAQWALDYATGVMWHWIVNVHHLRRNRTLEGIPARLWSEKVNDPMVGRSVSKRLDLVDIICGTRLRLRIDGSGVLHEGHIFHHPKVTEDFLKATLPEEKRRSRGKRGKVEIEAIVYPHDCSHIYVVDHVLNRYVRLPNSKPRFAQGLSWAEAKLIKASDRRLDKHFVDEEDLILAKYEFLKMRDGARAAARAERAILQAKKRAKRAAQDEELVVFTLIEGDYVETGTIEPTVRGDAPYDVPQEMPAMVRESSLIPHKDQPRNAQKAKETRKTNDLIKELREAAKAPVDMEPVRAVGANHHALPVINDPSAFLDALSADLD
ncbi:DDE-type integrase/transposase/recombinase [Rhizobium leguminosarum]|nr:DDE-type integrase/transposase/recombinase [Rhizobium leguminosarum]